MTENPFLDGVNFETTDFDEFHNLDDNWYLKRCRQIFNRKGIVKVGVTHDPDWLEFTTLYNGTKKSICFSKGTLLRIILSADYDNFRTNVCYSLGIDPALLDKVKSWQIQAPLSYYEGLSERKRRVKSRMGRNWRDKNLGEPTKEGL
jgi:hypothetical protein